MKRAVRLVCHLLVVLALGLVAGAQAGAAPAGPHWSSVSQAQPSHFKAGDTADAYRLIARNDGAGPTSGTVTLSDVLPEGVAASKVTARAEGANGSGSPRYELICTTLPVACTYEEGTSQRALAPGTTIVMTIKVSIAAGLEATELENLATVSGGGAPSASAEESTPVSLAAVPFGLSYLDIGATEESGEADTQAGSHPYELTASLAFTIGSREAPSVGNDESESPLSNSSAKDLEVELPPGLVGDPSAVPRCSEEEFQSQESLDCPLDTQVGTVTGYFYGTFHSAVYPLYNVVPPPGEPVELGFTIAGIGHVPLFLQVRDDVGERHEYALQARLNDIPEDGPLQGAILTLWGVPADGSHDLEREGTTGQGSQRLHEFCKPKVQVKNGSEEKTSCPSGVASRPFLTLPSRCEDERLDAGAVTDSWQGERFPAEPQPLLELAALEPLTGCEHLSVSPSLDVQPETAQAGAPAGYVVHLHVPQNEDPTGLATPDLRRTVVALPPGTVLSPSAGNGLEGCSEAQFAVHELSASSCPAASTIGTVQIVTPLLVSPLEGQLFLGTPACEPCSPSDAQEGRMIRLFVQAQGSGVTIKLAGSVAVNQLTGQLTASFPEDPQLPWEDLELRIDGGPGAPLANGSSCAAPLASSSQLTPYSSESEVESSSEQYELTGCEPPRFDPSFIAGTTNNEAGAFSPLTVTVWRTDGDEDLQRFTVHLASGLLGMLSSVQRCPEAPAQAGTCGPQSRIGSVTVGAGPGPDPLDLNGSVYLTGSYEGAPFGLAIVVPAVAGPLDLGAIDVRAAIDVNPSTAALTIASDSLPEDVDGVPLQIKLVSVDVEREGFTFNPTDCTRMALEGELMSVQGTSATASSPFQAANCATLSFAPKLTALTHARPSREDGAYLHLKVSSGRGQANIAKLKVDLPKQLPSRLATLRKACVARVFEANPAACPAASVVGAATVVTPVLGNPLSGPAYLVSHGGAAFPDLEMVLGGEGVVLRLDGQTSIKAGVTSSTFKALPDAPISTVDLVLGVGPHSALAANLPLSARGSMCGQRLAMPTEVTGQNGAVVKQTTIVAVSGCPRSRRHRRPR
jgi:hypothetical protein